VIGLGDREISATPRDIQEEFRISDGSHHIHPDRENQVHDTISNFSDLDLNNSEPQHPSHLIEETQQLIKTSQKERIVFNKRQETLWQTRSGRILAKPMSKKQWSYL